MKHREPQRDDRNKTNSWQRTDCTYCTDGCTPRVEARQPQQTTRRAGSAETTGAPLHMQKLQVLVNSRLSSPFEADPVGVVVGGGGVSSLQRDTIKKVVSESLKQSNSGGGCGGGGDEVTAKEAPSLL